MASDLKQKRNIAILAHVDAGKTTVSERLLYFTDTIPGMGEVSEGLATMDYLEEERRRGITIEAGIASYTWKGVRTTFVDTPGHVDFGVEVDFALRSVEGVILVISGVSGIQSQTLEAFEKIRENRNLPLLFINKLDVAGAEYRKVLEQIKILIKVPPVILTFPVIVGGKIDGVVDVANQLALFRSVENPRKLIKGDIPSTHAEEYAQYRKALIDFSSRYNDSVLEAYLAGTEIEVDDLMSGVALGLEKGEGIPIYMGSALKNVGIRQLLNGINKLLPPPWIPPNAEETLGFVLKVRWYRDIGKIYLAKIFSQSAVQKLENIRFFRVFAENLQEIKEVETGDIVALQSLAPFAIGQSLGVGEGVKTAQTGYRPLLQARLEAKEAGDHAHIDKVLKQLAEVEPSVRIESDLATGGWILHAVGELQLDVLCRRLSLDHDCDLSIGNPKVQYLEKLKSQSIELNNAATGFGNLVEIKMSANKLNSSDENHIQFCEGLSSTEKEILQDCYASFCSQGVCGMGQIAGLNLRITHIQAESSPIPTPLLAKTFLDGLKLNLKPSDFEVFEPIMRLEIIVPEEFCGGVLSDLASRGGVVRKIDADGCNSIILIEIPLERTFGYTTLLRSLSRGMGVFVLTYEKHGVKKRV